MRRFALFATGGAIWLLLMAVPVFADNGPHVMNQAAQAAIGSCSGCHRAHSGQAPMLLKVATSTLCLSCHNGAGATTNVVGGVGYAGNAGALRGGGFEFALIDTAVLGPQPGVNNAVSRVANIPVTTPHATTSAHSVNGSAVTMWGAGADGTPNTGKAGVDMTCASCHNPHGNGQYRILNPTPDGVVVDPWVSAVYINDATTKAYATTNYGQQGQFAADAAESPLNTDGSALQYNYAATTTPAMAAKSFKGTYLEASSRWCALCHTRYFGATGFAGNRSWTDGGTIDAVYTFRHAIRNIVDPSTNGSPTTGIINPISASTQLRAGATLGSYTAVSSGQSFTYRGVAILSATTSGVASASEAGNGTSSITGHAGDNLTTSAPRCITCHVSHGTPSAAGSFTTNEDSLVTGAKLGSTLLRLDGRTVCQACHAK